MICSKCGQTNVDNVQFCTTCGQALVATAVPNPLATNLQQPPQPPMPMATMPLYGAPGAAMSQCRVCGTVLPPNTYHCSRCGTPVGTVVNPNDPTASSYYPVAGVQQFENTSGQKGSVPPELQGGWNWGAAFLSLFWAIAHRVWWIVGIQVAQVALNVAAQSTSNSPIVLVIALLNFMAGIALFIYIGIRGNRLAWQNRRFDSIEHCKSVQRRWGKWVLGLFLFYLALIIIAVVIGFLVAFNRPSN